jgi:hypothetical protein
MQAKPQQLISAARLLKEAQDLVGDVETIMGGAGYPTWRRGSRRSP